MIEHGKLATVHKMILISSFHIYMCNNISCVHNICETYRKWIEWYAWGEKEKQTVKKKWNAINQTDGRTNEQKKNTRKKNIEERESINDVKNKTNSQTEDNSSKAKDPVKESIFWWIYAQHIDGNYFVQW